LKLLKTSQRCQTGIFFSSDESTCHIWTIFEHGGKLIDIKKLIFETYSLLQIKDISFSCQDVEFCKWAKKFTKVYAKKFETIINDFKMSTYTNK
jgi:hypothetical protein